MELEQIQTEIQLDSVLNETKLDTESLKIPMLHSKWYNYLIFEAQTLKRVERTFNKVKKARIEYYLGKAPDEVYKEHPKPYNVLKQDLELYLSADDEYQVQQELITNQQIKIDLIEQFLKQVSQRSFNIKNAIDFMKFKSGL